MGSPSKYIVKFKSRGEVSARLICLPYAGASASVFSRLGSLMPPGIETVSIELPGRGSRLDERPFFSMRDLINDLFTSIEQEFNMPFLLYGHSMGGVMALELAKASIHQEYPILGLIASGCAAPHLPLRRSLRLSDLSTHDLILELGKRGGVPEQLLLNRELLDIFLPAVRADLSCRENWLSQVEELDIPIHVLSGTDDQLVGRKDLTDWQKHSKQSILLKDYPGDHFFINSQIENISSYIARQLLPQSY